MLIALFCMPLAIACGQREDSGGGAATAYQIPDPYLSPEVLGVPIGSREVAVSPPPGPLRGALLLRLYSEPGAIIRYAFRQFDDGALDGLSEYKDPMLLLPPVTLWAQAEKDGVRGPVRSFSYTYHPEYWTPPAPLVTRRLTHPGWSPPEAVADLQSFVARGTAERAPSPVKADGLADDWSPAWRLHARDGLGDVPESLPFIDLSWFGAGESETAIYFVMAMGDKPRSESGVYYGVDFGPANITAASFGPGTSFVYRVEANRGTLTLQRKDNNEIISLNPGNHAAYGDVVEFRLLKQDLPLIDGQGDLAIRPYTVYMHQGATVLDRMEPLFMRSSFALTRDSGTTSTQPWTVDFLTSATLSDPELVPAYQSLARTFLAELEALNGMRFQTRGTLPIYHVESESNGYTGLNTTDRGLLTTVGPRSSLIAKAQILGHELAHYQNARNAQIKSRWLQEGMSEWTAERLLYRHFPPRAVHRFLRKLRFDRLASLGGDGDLPLDQWGQESASLGYEKSLAFLNLLEIKLGQAVLLKAFQQGVNEPMDSASFQSFLERETGIDLEGWFQYWVYPGAPLPEADPASLFSDRDMDGLLDIDELALGTDPLRADSDNDGYPDGEELFSGQDPLTSSLPGATDLGTVVRLVNAADQDTSALMRLGGAPGRQFHYSLNPFNPSPDVPYAGPRLLRPPYTLSVRAEGGSAHMVERPLYVHGVPVSVHYPQDAILPETRRLTRVSHEVETGNGVGAATGQLPLVDSTGDLPQSLAAYDVKQVDVSESMTHIKVTITTASRPDAYGEFGDYILRFENLEWPAVGEGRGFVLTPRFNLTVAAGSPYGTVIQGSTRETALLKNGVGLSFGDTLTVQIDKALLTKALDGWLEGAGERRLCVESEVTLDGGHVLRDTAGCLTLSSSVSTRRAAALDDAYGLGKHTVEAFVTATTQASSRASALAALGAQAVIEFERALGRPLLERRYWPLRVRYLSSGEVAGAGSARVGAYLDVPIAEEGPALDYLAVEQLARVASADLIADASSVPYWVQEAFIQWLASAAMYAIYPTEDVHGFHKRRLGDAAGYACFLDEKIAGTNGLCASLYSEDLPLAQWAAPTLASSGSAKSLAFMLELNAHLGSSTMARAFSSFANGMPDSAGFLERLQGFAPDQANTLSDLWTIWVSGSGNAQDDMQAIRARLEDADGDGLLVIDELRFGSSDLQADDYYQ